MTLLEQFYNEEIHVKGMLGFDELSDMQKIRMKDTFSFDIYKAKDSMNELEKLMPFTFYLICLFTVIIQLILLYYLIIGLKTIFWP